MQTGHKLTGPLAAGALAAVVGWWLRPPVLADDAAISLRYAERLATGDGLTYNDHEHVFGASNPLWVILVAIGRRLGLSAPSSAAVLGVLAFAASVALAYVVARRLSNEWGGMTAAALLIVPGFFREQALSGLEVGLAAALGLAAIWAMAERRDVLAGVALGLALLTKADALALAVAVVLAAGLTRRTTWRMGAVVAALIAPWLLFAWIRFGSPIPRSLTEKLGDEAAPFDPRWVVEALWWQQWVLLGAGALVVAWRWRGWGPTRRRIVLALTAWFGLHLVAYSVVDLGAPYPWYLAILALAPAILGGAAAGEFGLEVVWHRRRPMPAAPLVAGVAVTTVLAVLAVGARNAVGLRGDQPLPYQQVDLDRRAAGREVADRADDGDVVSTCFGWVAFEASAQTIDDTCGLNAESPAGRPTWAVVTLDHRPSDEWTEVATFDEAHRADPNRPGFVVLRRRG